MSEVRNLNEQGSFLKRGSLLRFIIGVIAATTTILTTYHTTIYGLREELNKKADTELVASIDNRLIHIEAILNEVKAGYTRGRQLSKRVIFFMRSSPQSRQGCKCCLEQQTNE